MGRPLVRSQRNYSLEISKLGDILFPYYNNNYYLIYSFIDSSITRYFQFFIVCILTPHVSNSIYLLYT